MNETPCPCCGAVRRRGQYLCTSCWDQLRVWVKNALAKRDELASTRLGELHYEIASGTPLREIEVTP